MNIQTTSLTRVAHLTLAFLGILALISSAAGGAALGATPDLAFQSSIPALVRVDLADHEGLERFAAAGLPVYAQLYTAQGQPYLLLPAASAEQGMLASLGFELQVLDGDSRGASYYLLYARSADQLRQASGQVRVLQAEGRQGLVRASAEEAERLAAQGIEINRLKLYPLVLPRGQTNIPGAIDPDPVIQGMIDQVDQDTVEAYDSGLSGEFPVIIGGSPYTILTRHTGQATPTLMATQYTYEHFQSLGLPVSYHTYTHPSYGQRRNVIAEQVGVTQPERIFLVTAHLDDTSQTPATYAPGADDNASGSVGVLIAADILSQYDFDCTIRYALFTGEEQGLYGSEAYAQDTYDNGDDIEGVLNLDMIAYNSDANPILDLHTRPGNITDLGIANLFSNVISAYSLTLDADIFQDGMGYSDHASFWQFGYSAILAIEDDDDFTPYYHTTNDQVETLDLAYFTQFVKAAVGTMAHMGCLPSNPGALSGQVSDAETSAPVPGASITAKRSTGQQFSTTTGSNGDYLLSLAPGTYSVRAEATGYLPYSTSGIEISAGMTTTLDIQLPVCHPVQAPDFTFSPAIPTSGQAVTFTGTLDASATPPVTYSWDFGDGGTGSGRVAAHTYTVSGAYAVSMTAANCAGPVTATHPVQVVVYPGINVSHPALHEDLPYGQTYTQTMTISNNGESTLTWSLSEQPEVSWLALSSPGGSLPSMEAAPVVVTYTAPLAHGIYNTSLRLVSDDPGRPQIDIPVSLDVPCTAPDGLAFSFSPVQPWVGEEVTFTGGVLTGSLPITYSWDFQDGTPPVTMLNDPSIVYTFPTVLSAAEYLVTLSVRNMCSPALTATGTLNITPRQAFLPLVSAEAP